MIISEEHREAFGSFFDEIYKGDERAKELSFMLLECFHVWDDHFDQDKAVSKADANKAWCNAMVKLPTNALYRAMPEMPYLVRDVYFKWLASNAFEDIGIELDKSYVLRAELYGLFTHIACNIFGFEYAESITAKVWAFYGEDKEKYLEEFSKCQTR